MEEQAVVLRVQNNLARKSNRIMKRIFDIVATVCGGLLILPILAIVAVLIYLDSPGPIVFGHKRVGQGGKEFPYIDTAQIWTICAYIKSAFKTSYIVLMTTKCISYTYNGYK